MEISFSKYVGSGNDFIFVDNREQKFDADPLKIRALCDRKRGIGADGLICLEQGEMAPYRMRIYNSDGLEAEMCGNGIRCLKRFCEDLGVMKNPLQIETKSGILSVTQEGESVSATMGIPTGLKQNIALNDKVKVDFIDTGVPHAVQFVEDLESLNLESQGSFIRHHEQFHPKGANANFVQILDEQKSEIYIRTFERGVEGETLACGTGATASAILAAIKYQLTPPITVIPRSQEKIIINFQIKDNQITNVTQTGPAQFIFQGSFTHAPKNTS